MRIIVCDSCSKRAGSNTRNDYLGPRSDWIIVEANKDDDHGQFCSWVCLAAWATNKAMEHEGQIATETET